MSKVFVKGYMRNARHVTGYTRRMSQKANFVMRRLIVTNEGLMLQHARATPSKRRGIMGKIQRNNERSRRIINKYF